MVQECNASLISHTSKILLHLINRITPITENLTYHLSHEVQERQKQKRCNISASLLWRELHCIGVYANYLKMFDEVYDNMLIDVMKQAEIAELERIR